MRRSNRRASAYLGCDAGFMSEHYASIEWSREGRDFGYETYSRQHVWRIEGDIAVPGRAAPGNIPKTAPSARGVDPEQAFVAERYVDDAVGVLDKDWMSKVTLRPVVAFSGRAPSD